MYLIFGFNLFEEYNLRIMDTSLLGRAAKHPFVLSSKRSRVMTSQDRHNFIKPDFSEQVYWLPIPEQWNRPVKQIELLPSINKGLRKKIEKFPDLGHAFLDFR